jgi:hypothetical protein
MVLAAICCFEIGRNCARILLERTGAQTRLDELPGDAGYVA